MNKKAKYLGVIFFCTIIIVLICSYYFFKASSYYDTIRVFNNDIETNGRSLIERKIFDLNNKSNKDEDEITQLEYLQNLDFVEGKVIDFDIKCQINDTEVEINKVLYIKEINELHFGIKIRNTGDISRINFELRGEKNQRNDFIRIRTFYRVKGFWSTFERFSFKNLDIEKYEKLFLVINDGINELHILLYENEL
jgi:hypothetical protein